MYRNRAGVAAFFHEVTKDIYLPNFPSVEHFPEEWTTAHYKEYKSRPQTSLTRDTLPQNVSLADALARRRSSMTPIPEQLSFKDFSTLITSALAEQGGTRVRPHPSGGARYPLEYYIVARRIEGLVPGIYHYNVRTHVLEQLSKEVLPPIAPQEFVEGAACVICMSAIFDRTVCKYAARGYRYVLLEAGHVGQNIYLTATALGRTVRSVGTYDRILESLIGIDGEDESLVYSIVIG